MSRDKKHEDALIRCTVCGAVLATCVYESWVHGPHPLELSKLACESCHSVSLVCECERKGSIHPIVSWPPDTRLLAVGVMHERERSMKVVRHFIEVVTGRCTTPDSSELASLATGLRNHLVGTTLAAAVSGAMNGATNRLAIAQRIAVLIREAPEVPDPPPCFTPRMSVPEMTRQILVFAKSIMAVEANERKTFA